MHEDRRRHPRFAVLVKASAEYGGARQDLVCVDAGPGGGYFTGRVVPKFNEFIEFALRPPGPGTPRIDLRGEVVYVPKTGEPRHPGFAVRWLTASSRVGVEPLQRVLQDILHLQPAVALAANESGEVRFDFATQPAAATSVPVAHQSPTPSPGRMSPRPSAMALQAADMERRSPEPGQASSTRIGAPAVPPRPEAISRPIGAPFVAQRPAAQRPHGQARWSPSPMSERPDASDAPAGRAPRAEAKADAAWRGVANPALSPTFDSSDQIDSTQRYAPLPEDSRPSSVPAAPGAMSATPWPEGIPLALAERYGDLRLLGRGGHGVVFRANDQLLDREVVLKFMVSGAMPNEMARRYFLREVKLAASLSHPNIVNIYDLGISEGVLYYAMEYIVGEPLVELLTKVAVIRDADELWSLVSQLCDALAYAHDRGILHRDVKPENVLLTPDGKIKLFDFGLARRVADGFGDQSLLIGTPYYMAPEQITSSDKVDRRADIYSLGVLLYRMCTGVLPFTTGNLFVAHAIEPVPDPRMHRPDLPPALAALLFRLLAKLPDQRPQTCAMVAQELHRALFGP